MKLRQAAGGNSPAGPSAVPCATLNWLSGIRVVECTIGVSTPLTARVLSDLGADVVRLESRAKLDVNRARLPRRGQSGLVVPEEGFGLLHEANAGKRSVLLDLKTSGGRELFLGLIDAADVFVQNFVPGWLERLALSIDQLRARNPPLIVLSASCSGQSGPGSTQRAYAPVMTALAGVEGLIGYEDGDVQGAMASALADLNAAYMGAFALLSALVERGRTGAGCHLDLSQTEAAAALVGEAMVEWQLTGEVPGPRGNTGMDPSPWRLVSCGGGREWLAVDGIDEAAFARLRDRAEQEPVAELADWCRRNGYEAAEVAGSPTGLHATGRSDPLSDVVQHPMLGPVAITTLPWALDGVRPGLTAASPLLGEDTSAVLGERLGLDDEAIARYEAGGVLR